MSYAGILRNIWAFTESGHGQCNAALTTNEGLYLDVLYQKSTPMYAYVCVCRQIYLVHSDLYLI